MRSLAEAWCGPALLLVIALCAVILHAADAPARPERDVLAESDAAMARAMRAMAARPGGDAGRDLAALVLPQPSD